MNTKWTTLALFALSASPLLAQTATFAKIPFPCSGAGNATYTVSGPPKLGTTMQIVYTGPNHGGGFSVQRPIFLLGLTMLGPISLPPEIPAIPAACYQTTSMEWAIWMPGTTKFQDTVSLPIPNDPALRGFPFYVQWLLFTAQYRNPPIFWFEASEVGKAVIGN
jgi:hypothetical protein